MTPMDLIIENGTIVASANSYVTVAEAVAFAANRGVTLPGEDATKVLVIKSMDWLESLYLRYQGALKSETQELQWPRTGITVNGFTLADTVIPKALKNAQCQVIMDLFSGIDPQANFAASPAVIKEKVDVLETTYSELTPDSIPYLRKALDFLQPLFGTVASGGTYFATRV
jgi:hypothetical protein